MGLRERILGGVALAAVVLHAGPAGSWPEGVGHTEYVSLTEKGVPSTGGVTDVAVSGDGRFVAFTTNEALVRGDHNYSGDVYVRDRWTGTTVPASVAASGSVGDDDSYYPSISLDGRYVAFVSEASDLVEGDHRYGDDVFVRDLVLGETTLASVSLDGGPGDSASFSPAISPDGRYVAFASLASDLVPEDTYDSLDVFVRDFKRNRTSRIPIPADAEVAWDAPAISADGRRIAFTLSVPVDEPSSRETRLDVVVYDRVTGQTEWASVGPSGQEGNGHSWRPSISRDGRYVAFASRASNFWFPRDRNRTEDVFLRDLQAGTTTIVSITPLKQSGNGSSGDPSMSADGRSVAFLSHATDLTWRGNGWGNVFVRDLAAGMTEMVSLDPLGRPGDGESYAPSISANGRFVAFASWAELVLPDRPGGLAPFLFRDRWPFCPAVACGAGLYRVPAYLRDRYPWCPQASCPVPGR